MCSLCGHCGEANFFAKCDIGLSLLGGQGFLSCRGRVILGVLLGQVAKLKQRWDNRDFAAGGLSGGS